MHHALRSILSALVLCLPAALTAQVDGYGPDAWRVFDVAPDDRLNARSGPGTEHLVLGSFPHDATGLRMTNCVPYLPMAQFSAMTPAQRAALPPRWCLVHSRDGEISGWVSARYLAEDTGGPDDPASDPQITAALDLVQQLYDARLNARLDARTPEADPLSQSNARDYFFADGVTQLAAGPQADPLFGAQDTRITRLRIRPAPDHAMFRGMLTIHVDFHNFDQPQQAIVVLRVDPDLTPPAPRIMRIEHDGWTFP